MEDLRKWSQQLDGDALVLTTQKDLVKLRRTRIAGRELWALRIQLQVEAGEEALDRELRKVVSG